jgi:hypothetical protein
MQMANNSANVSAAKPGVKGAIFWAPAGTAAPTDASTDLGEAFESVGYVSEEGLIEKETRSHKKHKAWGGDTAASSQTEYVKAYDFTMIETNETTMKIRYGAGNVSVSNGKVTQVKHNAKELPEGVWVVEMIIAGKIVRKVMPKAKIDEIGDIAYNDGDLVAYEVTIGLLPDENGDYETDYYAEVA